MTDRSMVLHALNWLYDRVAGDVGSAPSPAGGEGDIDRWIRAAATQAGAAGFVSNLGGVLALPVALPANLVGTAAVQMRLIARIASARGYDLQSDEVKAFVFACLLGNAAVDAMKGAGVRIGMRLAPAVLQRLNQMVVPRLLVRFGAAGAASFAKVVPLLGGVVGGGLDAASTRVVGRMAKRVFVRRDGPAAVPAIELAPVPMIGPGASA